MLGRFHREDHRTRLSATLQRLKLIPTQRQDSYSRKVGVCGAFRVRSSDPCEHPHLHLPSLCLATFTLDLQ